MGNKPSPASGQSQAANAAATDTVQRADSQWRATQSAGAAAADSKIANLGGASDAQIETKLRERNAEIEAIKHNPVEAKVVEEPKPTARSAVSIGETGANILDGKPAPTRPSGPSATGSAPAATGGAEPEKTAPATAAPVAAPAGQKDAPFASAPATDKPVVQPQASVSVLRQAISTSPIVFEDRPAAKFVGKAASISIAPVVPDARFSDVGTPGSKATGLVSLAAAGSTRPAAQQPVLGIEQKNTTVMGDGLGTVSAMDAARQKAAEPVAPAQAKPAPKFGMTVGTGSTR